MLQMFVAWSPGTLETLILRDLCSRFLCMGYASIHLADQR